MLAALSFAADIVPLPNGPESASLNRHDLVARSTTRTAAVFTGDTILPNIGSGSFYGTEITFVNLESHPVALTLGAIKADGSDLNLKVENNGRMRGGRVVIEPNRIFVLRTQRAEERTEGSAWFQTVVTAKRSEVSRACCST
jgi:hypothetical protein